jgi:hypothetical protein
MGVMLQALLLGLSADGKPRTPMVELYQIEMAGDRASGFHCLVASPSKQGSRLEINGLRPLRLLRSRRV